MSVHDSQRKPTLWEPDDTVVIRRDTLRFLLHEFVGKARKANDWVGPLGILATIVFTILVSDFKDRLGLSGQQWQAIAGTTMLGAVVWLAVAAVQHFRTPSTDKFLDDICAQAIRRYEWRVLFFLKAATHDHLYRVLTFHDVIWDCFVLPHMRYNPDTSLEDQESGFRHCIASYLGLSEEQVSIRYMDGADLNSGKHSPRANQDTTYCFRFYSAVIQAEEKKTAALARKTSVVGGRSFAWLTLSEMEHHINTLKKNADVINHLTTNYDVFFNKAPNSLDKVISSDDLDTPR